MLYKIGEEKKFLRSVDILETQADVAKRLEKKYIEPLTEELTALRTEIAVKQQAEERQRYAKQFNNNVGEDDFKNLYYRVKSFGSNYVKNVFERVTQVIDQMNIEKQRQLTQEEQAKKKKLASQEEEKLVNLHGGRTGLYRILDFCDAPLEFKENGEKSFYVAVQSMTDNSKGVRWGMELKDRVKQLALKIGDFVRFNGDRIEKAQKIEQQHQRRGMRL